MLPTSEPIKTEELVLISHSLRDREIVLKIKDELTKKSKYNVKLSEYGSGLENLINNVEKSQIIMVVLTEDYEYDKICHLELKYACLLGKILVPVVFESNYMHNKEWTREIFTNKCKFYINKSKYKDCLKKTIMRELDFYLMKTEFDKKPVTEKKRIPFMAFF